MHNYRRYPLTFCLLWLAATGWLSGAEALQDGFYRYPTVGGGSIVFAAPSSNATILLVVVVGILLLGGHLHQVALEQAEPVNSLLSTIYFVIPHLEWFDVRDLVVHEQNLIAWWAVGAATLYAVAYEIFFLFAAWVLFRRKALN